MSFYNSPPPKKKQNKKTNIKESKLKIGQTENELEDVLKQTGRLT